MSLDAEEAYAVRLRAVVPPLGYPTARRPPRGGGLDPDPALPPDITIRHPSPADRGDRTLYGPLGSAPPRGFPVSRAAPIWTPL